MEPKRPEIDHRTIKLIVGLVAISLAGLTSAFSATALASISASYYEGGWSQSIFIGFLFAIAAFFVAYNGLSRADMVLSKVTAAAALCVALFPCECGGRPALAPYVHGGAATVMFLILTYFCYGFFQRAQCKGHPQAKVREAIYAACGIAILLSILALGFDKFAGGSLSQRIPRLVFYGESMALIAFGISWLTASRTLPLLTRRDERFSPFRESNPS